MFNNSISSSNNTLSSAMQTARLHNEALERYNEMFGGVQNNNSIRPSLVDTRFEHLIFIMNQERERADQLLAQAFSNS